MGTTEIDSPSTMMFTVTNMGGKVLNLGESISLPEGFSLAGGFGATTLDTFESTTFVVQMDAVDWGLYGGTVSFTNDDADENPFSFDIEGIVTPEPFIVIVDNGDPQFSTQGEWTRWTMQGYQNDVHESLPGNGSDIASWTFTDLEPGEYRVSVTWTAYTNRATAAPFTVLDNTTSLATVSVNQQAAPGQLVDSGVYWNDLGGSYQIDSGTLVVQLTDAPVGRVNADAVRIERIFDLGGVNSLEGDGFGIGSINSFEPGVADWDEPEIGGRDVALNRIEDGFDELQLLVSDLIADDSQAAIQSAALPSDRIIANWPDRDELVVDLLGELVDELWCRCSTSPLVPLRAETCVDVGKTHHHVSTF